VFTHLDVAVLDRRECVRHPADHRRLAGKRSPGATASRSWPSTTSC
jgi:hypothetical protein